ncbi:RPM1-interacting protein 4-like [Abrus precatorius]|uniref:RPM1-interacting protein 4-like n=1 Tax=Abrus precatorius TaxID=3816 RepID=A0A8B8JTV5_ABRPR|nr:RPM1-interacting protein 4-like [Abrus precatorius]
MAQRSHVPKFGNWESGDNVPYTAYFDKARQGRTGTKIINPNDPEENSDFALDNPSSDNIPPSKPRVNSDDPSEKGSLHSTNELHKSIEDGEPKHFIDSPARHDNLGSRSGSDSTTRQGVGGSADNRRRPSRQSTGSEYSIERSPLHRHARATGRDSPSWEGKSSYDTSHGTPGRSRLRPVNRGDETPDKGAAVPKFGEWDVNNPASADGYTHIFNKVREERQGGPGHVPGTPNERPHAIRGQPTHDKAQCCCFGWGKK